MILFDLLLVALVFHGAATWRVLRRPRERLIYGLLLASSGCIGAYAQIEQSSFWAIVALGCTVSLVGLPTLLEALASHCFSRGALRWAVWLHDSRAMLMPGSGQDAQQEILAGLALLEAGGVDSALRYYRKLLTERDDLAQTALIHEQIVGMFFWGERWREGIEHYERNFHPGYALLRPGLALSLLRAYGEVGALGRAAILLRGLEASTIGRDPGSAQLLAQAQLTFLAYAGEAALFGEIIDARRSESLGVSPATATLYHGIALMRAGDPQGASLVLRRVELLAEGSESRAVAASRTLLAAPIRAVAEIEPEIAGKDLPTYVRDVAGRLRDLSRTLPRRTLRGGTIGTLLLLFVLVGAEVLVGTRHGGGRLLLEHGVLTSELYLAGGAHRLLTSSLLHGDTISLVVSCWLVWIAGRVLERLRGAARLWLVFFSASIGTAWLSVAFAPDSVALIGGGSAGAIAAAASACVLLVREPGLDWSRNDVRWSLGLLLSLIGLLGAGIWLEWVGVRGDPTTLKYTLAFGVLVALIPALPRSWRKLEAGLVVALALATVAAYVQVSREDMQAVAMANAALRCEIEGVPLLVPRDFDRLSETDDASDLEALAWLPVPVLDGLYDKSAASGGALVQLWVEPAPPDLDADDSVLFSAHPTLAQHWTLTPADPSDILGAQSGTQLRGYRLRQNGVVVAVLLERRLTMAETSELVGARGLLAWPPSALATSPRLYRALLEGTPELDARSVAVLRERRARVDSAEGSEASSIRREVQCSSQGPGEAAVERVGRDGPRDL